MAELPLFWQKAFQRSTLLDIETTGLDPTRHSPVSAATMRYGVDPKATPHHFAFQTAERTQKAPYRVYQSVKGTPDMEPFAAEMWQKAWKSERARHVYEGGKLVKPSTFFTELISSQAAEGGFIWAHNVQFDITQWGSQFAGPGAIGEYYQRAAVEPMYPFDAARSRLWPSMTKQGRAFRRMGYDQPASLLGAMKGFYGEYREMVRGAVEGGGAAILDTQLVAQSVLGMAQEQGYMRKSKDVFTGTKLEALYSAWGFGKYPAHSATADVEAMARVMPNLVEAAEDLYAGTPLRGKHAAALYRLGAAQPEIAQRNVAKMFAQAQLEIRETGMFRHVGAGGEQIYSKNYEDILKVYEKRLQGRAYDMPVRSMWERMAEAGPAELEGVLAKSAEIPGASFKTKVGSGAAFARAEGKLWWLRRSVPTRVAIGAAAVAGLAYALTPDREEGGSPRFSGMKDAYNTLEGLQERGIAPIPRRQLTDFGSGWRGIVSIPQKFLRSEVAAAEYVKKSELLKHIANLKNELVIAEEAGAMGFEAASLTQVELKQLKTTIEKLKTAAPRKQGAILVAEEEMRGGDLGRIKGLIAEERFHEAHANSKVMRDLTMKEGAVPMEWLMYMEAEQYNVPDAVRKAERGFLPGEYADIKAGWREEYFAKMAAFKKAPDALSIEESAYLASIGEDRTFGILARHEKRYRLAVGQQNKRAHKALGTSRAYKMTMDTMAPFAPAAPPGIRLFQSPHLASSQGDGMVQRMGRSKKRSQMMYQP